MGWSSSIFPLWSSSTMRAAIFTRNRGQNGVGRADCRSLRQVDGPPEGGHYVSAADAFMTWLRLLLVLVATLSLTACEVVGDIFQAGMAVGVIIVVGVIALIGFLIAKIRS